MRSVLNRVMMLSVIYSNGMVIDEDGIEDYLSDACKVELLEASIQKQFIYGSRRDDKTKRISHSGYVGEMVYVGSFNNYMLLLLLVQNLSVGDNVVYGCGQIKVEHFL